MLTAYPNIRPHKAVARLQAFGKSFILPLMSLSVCGSLLGIALALSHPYLRSNYAFFSLPYVIQFLDLLKAIAFLGFANLPILFAVYIPAAMVTQSQGLAALSGALAYVAYLQGVSLSVMSLKSLSLCSVPLLRQVYALDIGVLGAILTGYLTFRLHQHFKPTFSKEAYPFFLPCLIGRLTPVWSLLAGLLCGLIVPWMSPVLLLGLSLLQQGLAYCGPVGPFIFGVIETLLKPLGLHTLFVQAIRFSPLGGCAEVGGNILFGAMDIFYAQASNLFNHREQILNTQYLAQGKIPSYLGGLPGAAVAVYYSASEENRSKHKKWLIGSIIASGIWGVTEPIEAWILFASPICYFAHALFVGLGFFTTSLIGAQIGNIDGSLIDFVIWGVLQGARSQWVWVLLLSMLWFAIYCVGFSWVIQHWNVETLGREIQSEASKEAESLAIKKQVKQLILGLGGSDNVSTLESNFSRLKLALLNITLVDTARLQAAGAIGLVQLDNHNMQIVLGPKAEVIKDEMVLQLRQCSPSFGP